MSHLTDHNEPVMRVIVSSPSSDRREVRGESIKPEP